MPGQSRGLAAPTREDYSIGILGFVGHVNEYFDSYNAGVYSG